MHKLANWFQNFPQSKRKSKPPAASGQWTKKAKLKKKTASADENHLEFAPRSRPSQPSRSENEEWSRADGQDLKISSFLETRSHVSSASSRREDSAFSSPNMENAFHTLPTRPQIRTNPWVTPNKESPRPLDLYWAQTEQQLVSTFPSRNKPSRRPCIPTVRVADSSGSVMFISGNSSSGYSSQDSSPESSVHAPDWNAVSPAVSTTADKAVDCTEDLWELEEESETEWPLDQNGNPLPRFHAPPPPPLSALEPGFRLEVLDCRLAELRTKSAHLRCAVRRAREERGRRLREKQVIMDSVHCLRRDLKWVIRTSEFEVSV